VRDFIYIQDVLDAYMMLTKRPDRFGGSIFNIGCGEQHSVGEVAEMVIELTGCGLKPISGSPPRWASEPAIWQADISKAKKALRYVVEL
jgi:nucleoside-diphosphate-sugar epimerase